MNRNNNRIKFVLCLLMVCVLLVGCTSVNETQEVTLEGDEGDQGETVVEEEITEETEEDPIVIAIAINNMDESQVKTLENYEKAVAEYGYEFIYTNAGGNVEKQISDVESLMVQEPDVIGIQALDSQALADIADEVYAAGIPVASVYYGINSENLVFIAGSDPYYRGYAQGLLIKEFLINNPEVTLYTGYMWGSLAMEGINILYDSMMDAINEDPDVAERFIIIDERDTNWAADVALNVTEDWLQTFPEMNCIVAQADQMCVGGVSALEAAGEDLSEWYIFGQDVKAESFPLIQNGSIYGSSVMDYEGGSYFVIESLVKIANGEIENGETMLFDGGYIIVTSENIDEYSEWFQ